MAYEKIKRSAKPIACDANNTVVEGFLLGAKLKTGRDNKSTLYLLRPVKDGDDFKMWGSAAIDEALLDAGGRVKAEMLNKKIKVEFDHSEEIGDTGKTFNVVDVYVDRTASMPKRGRDYQLKK